MSSFLPHPQTERCCPVCFVCVMSGFVQCDTKAERVQVCALLVCFVRRWLSIFSVEILHCSVLLAGSHLGWDFCKQSNGQCSFKLADPPFSCYTRQSLVGMKIQLHSSRYYIDLRGKFLSDRAQSNIYLYSVQFSHSVVSDSLRPHELQHARPPCPSPTPRVHSDSCPSNQWCHPTGWISLQSKGLSRVFSNTTKMIPPISV